MTEQPLTVREILKFYLPLVLTAQMMTVSSPLINLGLGRTDDPKLALAAYAVGFAVSVLLHCPLFISQQVSTALVKDRQSFHAVLRFFLRLAALSTALDLLVALTRTGDWVFVDLIGATPRVAAEARIAVLLMAPIPVLIALRGIFQSLTIQKKRTLLITITTLHRLVWLVIVVFAGVFLFHMRGAAAGALALTVGVGVETASIMARCWRYIPERALQGAGPGETPLDSRRIRQVSFPLMLNSLAWSLQRTMINGVIARTGEPELALAGFGLVHPLLLLTSSPLMAIQSASIVLPVTLTDLRTLRRFAFLLSLGLSAVMLGAFGLAGGFILERFFAASGDLLRISIPALVITFPEPIFLGVRAFSLGMLLKLKRTGIVVLTATSKLIVIALLGFAVLALGLKVNGAVLGVLLMLAAEGWDMSILLYKTEIEIARAPRTGPWAVERAA